MPRIEEPVASSVQTPLNLDEVLRMLNAATDKGTISWKTTAEEGTFRAELGIGMARIEKEEFSPRYALTLVDDQGTTLEEFQTSEEGSPLAIEELYKKARRQALNLNSKLRGLYNHLKVLAGES